MELQFAPDVQKRIKTIVKHIDLPYIKAKRIVCFRSYKSKSRARARIWSFPRIWQMALKIEPHYVIEVLSEKFDHLKYDDQTKILIHELMHIPHSFGGGFRSHRPHVTRKKVERMYKQFIDAK